MDKLLIRSLPLLTCKWLIFSDLSVVKREVRVARYVQPYLRDLYLRRLIQGPEKYRPRSAWKPWSQESELYAFRHRINENIDPAILRVCVTDYSFASYANNNTTTQTHCDNTIFSRNGRRFSEEYITSFLRKSYPRLPEEWIACIKNKLLSDAELAYVGSHLGINDILLYTSEKEHATADSQMTPPITGPPPLNAVATSLLALIGSLTNNAESAKIFIRDFILTRLLHLEFCADFDFPLKDVPFDLLEGVLRRENRGPPEARLQRQASMNTLLACYQVGIYSDRLLIGEAPGETVEIAEKEAAFQALRNLFGIHDSCAPLPFSGPNIPLDDVSCNPTLKDYLDSR